MVVEPQHLSQTLDPHDLLTTPLPLHPAPDIPAYNLAEIRRHFNLYDVDGSGHISLDELRRGYEHEGRDPEEALESIKYYDLDGDDEINLDEFARWSYDSGEDAPEGEIMAAALAAGAAIAANGGTPTDTADAAYKVAKARGASEEDAIMAAALASGATVATRGGSPQDAGDAAYAEAIRRGGGQELAAEAAAYKAAKARGAKSERTTTMTGACLFLRCARSWWSSPNTCPKHLTHTTF